MFEQLAQMVRNLQNSQNVFDPAQFGDPIATQTGWGPTKGGGSNIRTGLLGLHLPLFPVIGSQ